MFFRLIYTITLCFVLTAPAFAEWEQLGQGAGGQIHLIKSEPDTGAGNPTRLYIGSDVAGLWRTTQNGFNAFSTNPNYEYLTQNWSIRFCQDIAFDTSTDPIGIFIATQTGVYYSYNSEDDEYTTWKRLGSEADNERIMDVPLNSDPDTLPVEDMFNNLSKVSTISVVRYDSGNKLRVYAGCGSLLVKSTVLSHATGNIWKYDCTPGVDNPVDSTTDSGIWTSSRLKPTDPDWVATTYKIVANQANVDQLWVCTEDGVFYSNNGGTSWEERSNGLDGDGFIVNLHCNDIIVNPDNFDTDARVIVKGIDYEKNGGDQYLDPNTYESDPKFKVPGGYYRWKEDTDPPTTPPTYKWFRVQNVLQYHDGEGHPDSSGSFVVEWNAIAIDEKSMANDSSLMDYVSRGNQIWGNYVFIGASTAGETTIQYSYNGNNVKSGGMWKTCYTAVNDTDWDAGWQQSKPLRNNPHSLYYAYNPTNGNGCIWAGKSGSFFRSASNFFYVTQNGEEIVPHFTDPANYGWSQEYSTQNGANDEWANRGMVNTTVRHVTTKPDDPDKIFMSQGDRGILEAIEVNGNYYFKEHAGGMKVVIGQNPITLEDIYGYASDGFFVKFHTDSQNTNAIYASANDSTAGASGLSGLFKSTNAGSTWVLVGGGHYNPGNVAGNLPCDGLEYWDMTADTNDLYSPLWLGTVQKIEVDEDKEPIDITLRSQSGVYQSSDNGSSWTQILKFNNNAVGSLKTESVTNIQAIPHNANPNNDGTSLEDYRLIIGTWKYTEPGTGSDYDRSAGIWTAVKLASGVTGYGDWTDTADGWKVKKVISDCGNCSDIAIYADSTNHATIVLVSANAGLYISTDAGDNYTKVLDGDGQVGFGGVAVDVSAKQAYALRDGDYDKLGPGYAVSASPQLYACDFSEGVSMLTTATNWLPLDADVQPDNRRAWMMHVHQGENEGGLYIATRGTGVLKHDRLAVPVVGDLNRDGYVGLDDLDIVLNNWNLYVHPADPINDPSADPHADPSGDGYVGLDDLDVILNNWNQGTPPSFP